MRGTDRARIATELRRPRGGLQSSVASAGQMQRPSSFSRLWMGLETVAGQGRASQGVQAQDLQKA